ncbi:MAG: hypothetical protein IAF58_13470 [Leptolyngbya sp.]|nr:hypothetical protein [Candidatus Melainabacteria bacterium]
MITNSEKRPCLLVKLHDAVAPISISLADGGKLTLDASTALAGPGYHKYVIKVIRLIERESQIIWELPQASLHTGDDTGYLSHGDSEKLSSHFLNWLQAFCADRLAVLDGRLDSGVVWFSDPAEFGVDDSEESETRLFQVKSAIVGLTGPRDAQWLQNVVRNPAEGVDFFPWWSETNSDSDFGSGMHKILFKTCWRAPVSQSEFNSLAATSRLLENSYTVNPHRKYPMREWSQINHFLSENGMDMRSSEMLKQMDLGEPTTFKLGYRNENVRLCRGDWSMELPGDFVERKLEAESVVEAKSVSGPMRIIRFAFPQKFAAAREGVTIGAAALLDTFGRADIDRVKQISDTTEGGVHRRLILDRATVDKLDCYWLKVLAAVDGNIAFLSIFVESESSLDWAFAIANSLVPVNHLIITSINLPKLGKVSELHSIPPMVPINTEVMDSPAAHVPSLHCTASILPAPVVLSSTTVFSAVV